MQTRTKLRHTMSLWYAGAFLSVRKIRLHLHLRFFGLRGKRCRIVEKRFVAVLCTAEALFGERKSEADRLQKTVCIYIFAFSVCAFFTVSSA